MKQILLLVGHSGSGKDTIANVLESQYGLKVLKSFTSRPKRQNEGNTHTFIKSEEVEQFKDDMIAYTRFDKYEYFCTKQQLLDSDIYIIDPDGIIFLKSKLQRESLNLITIYIHVPLLTRLLRMYKRGDGFKKIFMRYLNDLKKFKTIDYDYKINNKDVGMSAFGIFQKYLLEKYKK